MNKIIKIIFLFFFPSLVKTRPENPKYSTYILIKYTHASNDEKRGDFQSHMITVKYILFVWIKNTFLIKSKRQQRLFL